MLKRVLLTGRRCCAAALRVNDVLPRAVVGRDVIQVAVIGVGTVAPAVNVHGLRLGVGVFDRQEDTRPRQTAAVRRGEVTALEVSDGVRTGAVCERTLPKSMYCPRNPIVVLLLRKFREQNLLDSAVGKDDLVVHVPRVSTRAEPGHQADPGDSAHVVVQDHFVVGHGFYPAETSCNIKP